MDVSHYSPRLRPAIAVFVGLAVALGGCTARPAPSSPGPQPLPTVQVLVFAAASLRNALDEARRAWYVHPHFSLWISTDSSATLATQIELGARADGFLSADTANAQRLVDKGLTTGPAVAFASNRLTIVVPASNPAGIHDPADLARPGVRIIAAGDAVPISRYAAQAVDRLAALPGAPAGFAAAYAANVRSREDNVRAVLAKIELGEGDAAIVYATDARGSPNVAAVDIPEAANAPTTYAGVVIRGAVSAVYAQDLLDRLLSPDGQAILARHGFLPAD